MTDSEKLDLLLTEMTALKNQVNDISEHMNNLDINVKELKRQQMRNTAELKAMYTMIFDEAERVHEILNKHKQDNTAHTA